MPSKPLRSIARTWFWFVVLGTLLGTVVAFGLAYVTPPSYTGHVTLLVTPAPNGAGITNGDLQLAQGLTPTFAELATTGPVLDRVIQSTKVSTDAAALSESVSTHVPVGTSLLEISVSNPDPANAAALANGIATELQDYAAGGNNQSSGLNVVLSVVDPAIPTTARDGPGILTRVALGAAIALFLAVSIAFLVENISPPNLDLAQRGRHAVPQPASPDADDAVPDRQRVDTNRRVQSTVGYDPLESGSAGSRAQITSRGGE